VQPDFSLSYLTTAELTPPEAVTVAAQAGYRYAGVRMLPSVPGGLAFPLMNDPAMLRETQARIADTGVGVFDIEIIRLGPDTNVAAFEPFLEAGGRLGARTVLVAGDDTDEARLTERFAALCDLGRPYGLTMDLEFMPFSAVRDLAAAMRIVGGADRDNGGILVDALHFDRSASSFEDLAKVPRQWLHYLQICDAPAEQPKTIEEMIHTARAERLRPGEGGLDLVAIFAALPRDVPVSIEVPTLELAKTVSAVERAALAREAAARVLAALPPERT
jgi:sugar phosphate isomerase/epimerase